MLPSSEHGVSAHDRLSSTCCCLEGARGLASGLARLRLALVAVAEAYDGTALRDSGRAGVAGLW